MSEKLPSHMKAEYGTMHGFRASKRKQLRALKRAVGVARFGSGFLPAPCNIAVDKIDRLVDELIDACSVKKWGR